jgi:hypothetical protein
MEVVLDAWTPLSFKRAMGNRRTGGHEWVAPGWVGDHARRLMAYRVLQSYQDNAARVFLGTKPEDEVDQHREYGDPALIVSQVVAALLGAEQTIVVDGASEWVDEEPKNPNQDRIDEIGRLKAVPDPTPDTRGEGPVAQFEAAAAGDPETGTPALTPPDPAAGPDPVDEADVEAGRGALEAQQALDDELAELTAEKNSPETEAAHEMQEWLDQWAKDERLSIKMLEAERNAVGLGDGVYVLGVNRKKKRTRLRVFDPGFYFPVLTDGNEDDFPERVHIAWEMESDRPEVRLIRRMTWELGPIRGVEQDGRAGVLRRAVQTVFGAEVTPLDGDVLGEDGTITRELPWNDEPADVTCYYSDGVWEIDTSKTDIDDLTEMNVRWVEDEEGPINARDLQIDFIPVVHLPNTVALANHYGRSTLSTVLQILDDIANADTDLQGASATAGNPVLALQGSSFQKERPTYRPGEILETGDGKMSVLDTSHSLDAILKYVESLLKRLSVNVRVPESVLGRVKASEVPSGVALALSFGPLASMVSEMRLVRDEKYTLLLKMAWRMALAAQFEDVPAEWIDSKLEFGSYLPQDMQSAVEMVTKLLTTQPASISLETAVLMLQAAGLPIEDAVAEVDRIQSRDFVGADNLLTATGDEDGVFEYLGRERPPGLESIKPPPVVLPDAPPGGAGAPSPAAGAVAPPAAPKTPGAPLPARPTP